MRAELDRQRSRAALEPRLGDVVREALLRAVLPVDRRDREDPPVAALGHPAADTRREHDRRVEIHRQDPPVALELEVDRPHRLVDPGDRAEDVDRSDPLDEPVDRRGVGEVEADVRALLDVDAGHARALGAEAFGDRTPDPVRRAGDERVPSLEQTHRNSSSTRPYKPLPFHQTYEGYWRRAGLLRSATVPGPRQTSWTTTSSNSLAVS